MSRVLITGNTYPVKEEIKALGGKWNPDKKGWEVPAEREAEAKALVAHAPKSAPKQSHDSNYRRGGYRGYKSRFEYEDSRCELCGRNKYTCGHCIGW